MAKYTLRVGEAVETHTNKDDVIVALVYFLLGYGVDAAVDTPTFAVGDI